MDTLGNNWNDLFKTVSNHSSTYLMYPNTYAFGTAGTFYKQCFPRDSLTVAYASMAYHWQEKGKRVLEGANFSQMTAA